MNFIELEKRLDKAFDINLKKKEHIQFNSYVGIMNFKLNKENPKYKITKVELSDDFVEKLNNKFDIFFVKERNQSIDKLKYNLFGLLFIYIHQNLEFDGFRYYFYEANYDLLVNSICYKTP